MSQATPLRHADRNAEGSRIYSSILRYMGRKEFPAFSRRDRYEIEEVVPHVGLRRAMLKDPALEALLPHVEVNFSLGGVRDIPFRLEGEVVHLSPALLDFPSILAVCARWGVEVHRIGRIDFSEEKKARSSEVYGEKLLQLLTEKEISHLRRLFSCIEPLSERGPGLNNQFRETLSLALEAHARNSTQLESGSSERDDTIEFCWNQMVPLEHLLQGEGDSRLVVDPCSKKNRYGTVLRPRPDAVHFSSSTASSISDYGFTLCEALRNQLAYGKAEPGKQLERADLADAIRDQLHSAIGVSEELADLIFCSSGTDAELVTLALCTGGKDHCKIHNIIVAPEETGRGVLNAGGGKWFDDFNSLGKKTRQGEKVWSDVEVDVSIVEIRDRSGNPKPDDIVSQEVEQAAKKNKDNYQSIIVHFLAGSKTGLTSPSLEMIKSLERIYKEKLTVVVDACQFRVDLEAISEFLEAGYLVQITGSKSLTGPPFSGAVLSPKRFRRQHSARDVERLLEVTPPCNWPRWWRSQVFSQFCLPSSSLVSSGSLFRWIPAIYELNLYKKIPNQLKERAFNKIRDSVVTEIENCDYLEVFEASNNASGSEFSLARSSIICFSPLVDCPSAGRRRISLDEGKRLFNLLNSSVEFDSENLLAGEEEILKQEMHIGQPVLLGDSELGQIVLRIVIGARFFSIVDFKDPKAHEAALTSEIMDVKRVICKLCILLRNRELICG